MEDFSSITSKKNQFATDLHLDRRKVINRKAMLSAQVNWQEVAYVINLWTSAKFKQKYLPHAAVTDTLVLMNMLPSW